MGREGRCKQHWRVLAVPQPHWACPCSWRVCPPCPHCSGSRLLHWEPSEAGPGLHAPPRSKLRFVPFPGLSSSGDEVFGKHSRCDLLPPPSLPLGCLGVQPAHLLRRMFIVQNPKKSWSAKKPACSLVDNASLGLRLPPSGSGCLSLEGDGLPPASAVQFFVLCTGLAVS